MYKEHDLVRIAKRENNTKRNYLVVNCLQGKHIPVEPGKAMTMFMELAERIKLQYPNERLLLVGFAETATAIGACAAVGLGCKYIQTTREVIEGVDYLFFTESHSHATEQKLVKDDIKEAITEIDRIVFVEDEVTTGDTIHKIIQIIKQTYPQVSVSLSIASLLNGMEQKKVTEFIVEKIDLLYLVKTNHSKYVSLAEEYVTDGRYELPDLSAVNAPIVQEYYGCQNARRLVDGHRYQNACDTLTDNILKDFPMNPGKRILVLGTEEFMYPALSTAFQMEQNGQDVWFHATTRSPILVSQNKSYPLHSRFELRSMYEKGRINYIYNLDCYDEVFIITDATINQDGYNSLQHALQIAGNQNIHMIRWRN